MRRNYERTSALSPEEALAEYSRSKDRGNTPKPVNGSDVAELIDSLDDTGAWIEDIEVHDMDIHNPNPPGVKHNYIIPSGGATI